MDVRFWGVRGSVAVSGSRFACTGGNTSCVELVHDGERLILDGGTGLAALGDSLGCTPIRATVLFSHVHWDHIQGVPFFAPAWHPDARLVFAGAERDGRTLQDALQALMRPPTFPVTLDTLRAKLDFATVGAGVAHHFGPFTVTSCEQPHPDGVRAWRVEAGGRVVVYATDTEHPDQLSEALVALADGADLLVHDAQYTDAEYAGRRGWGHSRWSDAVGVARRAGAARVALFHHDPRRDDDGVAAIEAEAQARFPGASAAREGVTWSL